MKRILICLDGTWNKVAKPDEVTNVVKFAQSVKPIAKDGVQQVVYYNSGVGTGGPADRFLGGVFGVGIKANVQRAYTFLTLNYDTSENWSDEIYIIGFSRGAYTARALAAIINSVGVLKREEFERFEEAWDYYRIDPDKRRTIRSQRGELQKSDQMQSGTTNNKSQPTNKERKIVQTIDRTTWFRPATVKALGVWDTVGSYGVPAGFAISGLAYNFTIRHLGFHDRQLGDRIENAFHAMSIDESRGPFAPTFWTMQDKKPKGDVEQVWFSGVHSDVGGGYKETGLSDLPLIWMMDRLSGLGLDLDEDFIRLNVDPCPACELHNSASKLWWKIIRPYHRELFERRKPIKDREGRIETVVNEKLHWSVAERVTQGGVAGGRVSTYKLRNVVKPISELPASTPGELERRILLRARSREENWKPVHDGCWAHALPDRWLEPRQT
jgi:uncharacterized protein (DUF2235 family)